MTTGGHTIRGMAARTEDLESLLARIPDPAIRRLFSPQFILCAEHFDRFTIDSVLALVHGLDLAGELTGGVSARQVVLRRGFAPRAEIPVRWFFRKLRAAGYLDAAGADESDDTVYRARGKGTGTGTGTGTGALGGAGTVLASWRAQQDW